MWTKIIEGVPHKPFLIKICYCITLLSYELSEAGFLDGWCAVLWIKWSFSSPGLGHCTVFLGKTLNSHSASPHAGVKMGINKLWRQPNWQSTRGSSAMAWHPIQGKNQTTSSFMQNKPQLYVALTCNRAYNSAFIVYGGESIVPNILDSDRVIEWQSCSSVLK